MPGRGRWCRAQLPEWDCACRSQMTGKRAMQSCRVAVRARRDEQLLAGPEIVKARFMARPGHGVLTHQLTCRA